MAPTVEATFIVFDYNDADSRNQWLNAWNRWPDREVQANPHYVKLFSNDMDRPMAFYMHRSGSHVLYPFILRNISELNFYNSDKDAFDQVSPYGYGGPYFWQEEGCFANEEIGQIFWKYVTEWQESKRIISECIRFHLEDSKTLTYPGNKVFIQNNVVRSLDLEADDLFMDYEHKVRKNVKKALRSGLSVTFDQRGETLQAFYEIYIKTMQRREARTEYHFPFSFFESIINDLQGSFVIVNVHKNDKIVSTELVLCSAKKIYSFLGGTLGDYMQYRPNDLLKHETNIWARENGFKVYILGGGYGGDDGIYKYKLSFAPKGACKFHIGTRVIEPVGYSELVALRTEYEKKMGNDWQPQSNYFPAYRSQ